MNKKYLYLLLIAIAAAAGIWFYLKQNGCKKMDCKVAAKTKGHYAPLPDTLNVIKENSTIVFVEYERDGVAKHDYEYYKEIDPAFFTNVDEASFRNDGEAGGYLATVHIYKAIKKGETAIVFYKKRLPSVKLEEDTVPAEPVKEATYKFRIE